MSKIKLFVSVGLLLLCGPNIKAQEGFSRSAMEIVNDMSPGWNLGNTLDAHSGGRMTDVVRSETYWGQPVTKPELMHMMKEAGF